MITIWPDGPSGEVAREIYEERLRQEQLKAEGRFKYTCAENGLTLGEKLAVLMEEVGEAARAMSECCGTIGDTHFANPHAALRKELIQVAAVAMAWVESLPK